MQSVAVIAIVLLFVTIQVDGQAGVAKILQINEQQAQDLPLINNQTTECVTNVPCDNVRYEDQRRCQISLNNQSQRKCKIIFGDVPHTNVTALRIIGVLSELPDIVSKFENLTRLSIWRSQLQKIERAKLAAFRSIHVLILDENLISELASDTFDDLKNLTILMLSANMLKTIDADLFQELHNLENIYIGQNQLEVLPEGLFRNKRKLRGIWISKNKLNVLHSGVFKDLRNLENLSLDGNKLEVLPNGLFTDNQKLKKIWLNGNKINFLHRDALKDLRNLQQLYLDGNQLEVLPDGLFRNNQKLEYIWLRGNKIRRVECNFYSLPKLNIVDLSENICIDELFNLLTYGTTMTEMHTKIWSKCSNDSQMYTRE